MDTIRSIRGYISIGVGFIACPCHLPLTLPILLSLTAGTALGTWLGENIPLVLALSTAIFIGGMVLGTTWLKENPKPSRRPTTLCPPCEPHSQADSVYTITEKEA